MFPTFRTITDQIDSFAPVPVYGTSATTLQTTSAVVGAPANVPGDTGLRLASTTGRAAGDVLLVDQLDSQETVTIASIVTPAPAAPAANVIITAPLTKTHLAGAPVFVPTIVADKILQSKTLLPILTDPRQQFTGDTSNGSGGSAYWASELDGVESVPKPQPLNRLATGLHTQAVTAQDTAGNRATTRGSSSSRRRSPTSTRCSPSTRATRSARR